MCAAFLQADQVGWIAPMDIIYPGTWAITASLG